jgi:hypothetical protein
MMGRQTGDQSQLFYLSNLEERIPGCHSSAASHFAHLKTHHRFERMRLRGLSGARDEFHLAAIVQNRDPPRVPAAKTSIGPHCFCGRELAQ